MNAMYCISSCGLECKPMAEQMHFLFLSGKLNVTSDGCVAKLLEMRLK